MASLRIVGADGAEKIVELREGKVQIGRGRDNDVVLADQEKGVSRTHAELRFENGRYIIVDLQSQNGTWLNGRRVERGEVPPGAEITIGDYRLTIRKESPPSTMNVTAGATIARPVRDLGDLQIREHVQAPAYHAPPPRVPPARTAPQAPPQRNMVVAVLVVAAAVVLFGTVAYIFTPGGGGASPARAVEPAPTEPRPPEPSAAAAPEAAPVVERAPDGAEPATGKPNAPRHTPPNKKPDRVARKPGESLETWRTRSEALEMRYSYSKQALDRRDFAAAAGGFQAILLEEPGFLDAPQLLVQANAGLRATANGLFESGKRHERGRRLGRCAAEVRTGSGDLFGHPGDQRCHSRRSRQATRGWHQGLRPGEAAGGRGPHRRGGEGIREGRSVAGDRRSQPAGGARAARAAEKNAVRGRSGHHQ